MEMSAHPGARARSEQGQVGTGQKTRGAGPWSTSIAMAEGYKTALGGRGGAPEVLGRGTHDTTHQRCRVALDEKRETGGNQALNNDWNSFLKLWRNAQLAQHHQDHQDHQATISTMRINTRYISTWEEADVSAWLEQLSSENPLVDCQYWGSHGFTNLLKTAHYIP